MTPGRGDEIVELPTGRAALAARAIEVDDGLVDRLLAVGDHPLVLWREPSGIELAGAEAAASVRTAGPDRFERVRDWAAEVDRQLRYDGPPAARPRFLGGFAFDDAHPTSPPWDVFPAAWFVLPALQVVRTEEGTWLTVTGDDDAPAPETIAGRLHTSSEPATDHAGGLSPLTDQRPIPSRDRWLEQVGEIQSEIAAGRLRKAVLGHAIEARIEHTPTAISVGRRLGDRHPACFRFVLSPAPERLFFGASPERLVEGTDHQLRTDALAGSRRRGKEPAADRALAASLRDSSKDAFEHEVVVEAIRERLGGCCEDVRTGERSIRQLASVQHLHTELEATRPSGCHLLDVAARLHPTPAVGGLPREVALDILDRLEAFERGWYAGPIGWFDAAGNGQFAIGIRSAAIAGSSATLFAGAGIVAESDPAAEWEELQLKYAPIRSTFSDR